MVRCINLDWLEVYVTESTDGRPRDVSYFQEHGFSVRVRDYGTRVYKEMFTILDERGEAFVEIRRAPFSAIDGRSASFLDSRACHIKLANRYCYVENPVDIFRQFLVDHGYALRSIFRIDVCLDFVKFDSGDFPGDFLRRYLRGRYSKINQSSINAHGVDTWSIRDWNSVSWGSPSSMVSTKFYNKSLELQQSRDKPYIRYAWFDAGLVHDPVTCVCRASDGSLYKPDVWRVEFSIRSSAAKWYVVEDCNHTKKKRIRFDHTLDMYDNRLKLLFVFSSLSHYYFHFKHYKANRRKDRCDDKILFKFHTNDIIYRPTHLAVERSDHRRELIALLSKLKSFKSMVHDDGVRSSLSRVILFLHNVIVSGENLVPFDRFDIQSVHNAFLDTDISLTNDDLIALDLAIARQLTIDFENPLD